MLRLLVAVLIGLLVWTASALAVRSGGHNPPTRKLEAAFKVAGGARAGSPDGCYPPAPHLAHWIRTYSHPPTAVARDFDEVRRRNLVYVIERGTRCNRALLALRARGKIYVLDTLGGEVYVRGQRNRRDREWRRGGRGPLRALTLTTRHYRFGLPDRAKRLEVRCPRKRYPLGGGMISNPSLGADGEGVYPNSYERLGIQRGYHITAVVIDRTPAATTPRWTTIQVVCGRGLVPRSSPRKTVFVKRNRTNAATARCPKGQYLFSGGFQRTNFTTPFLTEGGNYITESRAISDRAWRVTAGASGQDGGELTAIAYCVRNRRPLIAEVLESTEIEAGRSGTATTPQCPPGRALTAGGFSLNESRQAFFSDGFITSEGSWSATGFGYFGPATLTAYGYCLRVKGAS